MPPETPKVSRRVLVGSALAAAAPSAVADNQIAVLVRRADEANRAFIRGDMHAGYERAQPIATDFTLMQPFGGPVSHDFDGSDARLDEMATRFGPGEAALEIAQTYATRDMVVLVLVERQHGVVGHLPDQNWSLRVTQIYRRDGNAWALVHRHADPLTQNIGLERAAALARG